MGDKYDCTTCGACCFGGRDYVQVFPYDVERLGEARVAEFVAASIGESPASFLRPPEPQVAGWVKQAATLPGAILWK